MSDASFTARVAAGKTPAVDASADDGAARDIIVVKLGGRTQGDTELPGALAARWRATGGRLVIVHGGGDQISALQRLRGEEPVFVGGRRVTTDLALELVRMVLSGLANKQLVSALVRAGAPAVGISGEDAALLTATPIDRATFGHSGTPASVEPRLVHALLSQDFLPVISPVAAHAAVAGAAAPGDTSDGAANAGALHVGATHAGALNVNGDDAAAAIAVALGARELFLLADVPGVLDEEKRLIPSLSMGAARFLVSTGIAGGGMAAKLDACAQALDGGVARVRIGDLAALANPDAGTHLTLSPAARP